MVTVDYMVRAVRRCRRRTVVRLAFARALGIEIAAPTGSARTPRVEYEGMAECFANRETPMDGRL